MKNVLDFIPMGRENAISMSNLSDRMGTDQRTARKAVFNARCRGEIICSVCNGDKTSGYYRPDNASEILPYIRMQQSRILSAQKALKSVEKFITEKGACDDNG